MISSFLMAVVLASTVFQVRVQVVQTCTVSSAAVQCSGAARTPPIRVTVQPGLRVIEF